ncbi:unnamed protein product [Sphenostylis stenocarpa]|uniref:H15 domain-containing protein n=1 Tax=Sphenostylis stenocarpa TaxID=92480 RepID=A0AA86S514_9FABA|nr:unnamed protein product [Sphenostylis stenocarpa]
MATQDSQSNREEGFSTSPVMAHLLNAVASEIKKRNPSFNLQPRHYSLLERHLRYLFPTFHTPTHPPYALMISRAILGLKEETGSTKEAISEFIKREYNDLPWAHGRILSVQLEKLCEIGELEFVSDSRYVLKVDEEVKEQFQGNEKKKRRSIKHWVAERDEGQQRGSGRGRPPKLVQNTINYEAQLQDKVQATQQHVRARGCRRRPKPNHYTNQFEEQLQSQGLVNCPSSGRNDNYSLEQMQLMVQSQGRDHKLESGEAKSPAELRVGLGEVSQSNVEANQNPWLLMPVARKVQDSEPKDKEGSNTSPVMTHLDAVASKIYKRNPSFNLQLWHYSLLEHHLRNLSPTFHSLMHLLTRCLQILTVMQDSQPNEEEGFSTSPVMTHLLDNVASEIKKRNPSFNFQQGHYSRLECHLRNLFPTFHTPTHLPYALMIHRAISGLEEEIGSTKEAISEFIKKEYNDLPWAHGRILSMQLDKLCEIGEIELVSDSRYVLKVEDEVNEQFEDSEEKKKRSIKHWVAERDEGQQQHGRGRGRERSPKLVQNTIKYEAQLQDKVQARPQHIRGRGCGRPTNPNHHANQFEEQLQSQGLVNSPSSGRNDNHSLEQKQLKVQSQGSDHKAESKELDGQAQDHCKFKYATREMMDSAVHNSHILKIHHFFCFLCLFQCLSASKSTHSFPKEALPTKYGYLPITSTSTSAIFYAFYEAQNSTLPLSQTPFLIWLQGGPGCSSMIGNFYELGPWRVTQSLTLQPNPGAWNRIFGLLFLDSPIGTGFSVASTPGEIPKDQNGVAKHLFAAITRFVQLDPLFKHRPIYITGESYAGKYVPAIGYYILEKNARLQVSEKVNLAGVAIGDGLTDPETQVATHAVNAYYVGLINERQKNELEKAQLEAVRLAQNGNWSEATDARSEILRMLGEMTGLATLYDYTRKAPYMDDLVEQFLNIAEVKKALGINESFVYEICSDVVGEVLQADVMKSVKHMVEYLARRSRVLLYQGQHDLKDGVVQSEVWVKTMKWEGIVEFLNAERKIWKVNGELAGYVQKWKSLTNVVVLGAGHLVPADQPLNSQAMIEDWVLERGLFRRV